MTAAAKTRSGAYLVARCSCGCGAVSASIAEFSDAETIGQFFRSHASVERSGVGTVEPCRALERRKIWIEQTPQFDGSQRALRLELLDIAQRVGPHLRERLLAVAREMWIEVSP